MLSAQEKLYHNSPHLHGYPPCNFYRYLLSSSGRGISSHLGEYFPYNSNNLIQNGSKCKYEIVFWGQYIQVGTPQEELDHGITTFERISPF